MNYSNQPLSIDDQITRLKTNGLTIPDEAKAKDELKIISYFRLADYLRPLELDTVNHCFKPGSSIDDALKMYYFDKELRSLIFCAIQTVEVALRSKIIQHVSMKKGAHWFLDSSYFLNKEIFFDVLSKIMSEVKRSKEDYIKEYFTNYDNPFLPPVWKTIEVLTFGTLSKIYQNLDDKPIKKGIAQELDVPTHLILESWILCIAVLRNLCCHHNRVWNRAFAIKPQLPTKMPKDWISQTSPTPTKLYWQLCCLLYLENSVHPNNHFKASIKDLLHRYPSVDIAAMGFPANWEQEPLWK